MPKPEPTPMEALVDEMLSIYDVRFTDANSRQVAVETWTRQLKIAALHAQPEATSATEMVPAAALRALIAQWQERRIAHIERATRAEDCNDTLNFDRQDSAAHATSLCIRDLERLVTRMEGTQS